MVTQFAFLLLLVDIGTASEVHARCCNKLHRMYVVVHSHPCAVTAIADRPLVNANWSVPPGTQLTPRTISEQNPMSARRWWSWSGWLMTTNSFIKWVYASAALNSSWMISLEMMMIMAIKKPKLKLITWMCVARGGETVLMRNLEAYFIAFASCQSECNSRGNLLRKVSWVSAECLIPKYSIIN